MRGRNSMPSPSLPPVASEYHSSDFSWEELRDETERDPALAYHLSPHSTSQPRLPQPPPADAWRLFHRRHSAGNFFKERRYLLKEFPELDRSDRIVKVLEVGCGNGSTVLPILRGSSSVIVYACDCSKDILEKVEESISAASEDSLRNRFHSFCFDICVDKFPCWLFCALCRDAALSRAKQVLDGSHQPSAISKPSFLGTDVCCIGGIDIITLIFTLSAVPFNKMLSSIKECSSVLRPGGLILFRDYGLYDMTMLRFLPEQRVGLHEYMRSDGTLSYFFSKEAVENLFSAAGLIQLELEYCCVRSSNRKNGKVLRRVFVHGKFQMPAN